MIAAYVYSMLVRVRVRDTRPVEAGERSAAMRPINLING